MKERLKTVMSGRGGPAPIAGSPEAALSRFTGCQFLSIREINVRFIPVYASVGGPERELSFSRFTVGGQFLLSPLCTFSTFCSKPALNQEVGLPSALSRFTVGLAFVRRGFFTFWSKPA